MLLWKKFTITNNSLLNVLTGSSVVTAGPTISVTAALTTSSHQNGADVNIMVFDTEVYSNTGGQSSKVHSYCSYRKVRCFSGKKTKKKDLGMMAISYGYVYVAQVKLWALTRTKLIKAISEAEAYHGPSLVICYAPCINHGIKLGMGQSSGLEENVAVECGYWDLTTVTILL
jgi:pyruvate/2-oxoacid:ferredoxin oxidoreductase beta subunit